MGKYRMIRGRQGGNRYQTREVGLIKPYLSPIIATRIRPGPVCVPMTGVVRER